MNTQQNIRFGRITALITFLLGTAIFGLYYLTSALELAFLGYGYIVVAGLVNISILLPLLLNARKDKVNRNKLLATGALMLMNIPAMLIYCQFAFILLNTMRITFTNATQTTLTDINIVGCKPRHIDKLQAGQSTTIWVGITGDCSIDIDYVSNGHRKKENVAGYVTNDMGQKMKYNIGGKNPPIF